MTASLPPDCRVYVDGVRMADGGTAGEVDTDPVVLTDLRVTWGRDTTLDQPEPSTCAFTVLDVAGGARALDRLNIGGAVDIVAAAIIPTDPTVPTIDDPGFEAAAIGATPPSSTTNATVRVVAGGAVGAHAARIEPVDADYAATVVFPPGPFSADPAAWDARPRSRAGQAWHYGLTVARFTQQLAGLPGVSVEVEPVGFTGPRADALVRYASAADRLRSPVDAPAGWIVLAGDTYPPDALWLGLRVVIGFGPDWDDVGAALAWDDLGGAATRNNLQPDPRFTSTAGKTKSAGTSANATASLLTGLTGHPAGLTTAYRTTVAADYASTANWYVGAGPVVNAPTVGDYYRAGAWVRRSVAGNMYLRLVNVNGSSVNGPNLPVAANAWTWLTAGGAVAPGTTSISVIAMPGSALPLAAGQTLDMTGLRAERVADAAAAAVAMTPAEYFDGSTPDAGGIDYAWTGAVNASTSTATDTRAAVRWDDLGGALVDDLVMLAPAGGAQRQGAVFSGRITDLEARYDQGVGGTLVDVTAESHLAELGNRYVGDVPWLAQPLGDRFAAIVSASGQRIAYTVDPGVAGYVVSWRDVDRQPAARLLAELAQSCAGALWLATSLTSGPYLWLEDIDARPATAILSLVDGVIVIVLNPGGAGLLSLSACDVLLDPVRWVQTTEDDATRIAVRWRDQTLDDKGNPAPTERTYTIVDEAAELASGQRRIGLSTELATEADADRVGDAVLGRVRSPGWRVAGLTIRLDLAEPLDADLLSLVMSILDATTRIGAGIMLTDLPAWSPAGTGVVALYLEGGRFTNVDGAWELELLTSDARSQGESDVMWDEVPDPWQWDQFDPAITWNNLRGVGI